MPTQAPKRKPRVCRRLTPPEPTRWDELIQRPLRGIALAPFDRVLESPLYAKIVSGLVGLATLIYGDILFPVLCLLLVASAWDTLMGKEAATRRGEDPDALKARAGALTKMSGIVMVVIARYLEAWGAAHDIPGIASTNGAIAAAFAFTLVLFEMESIERHRIEMGARPIPGFSALVRTFRIIEGRMLAAITAATAPPPAGPTEPKEEP